MVDPHTPAASPPINIHIHDRLSAKDRDRLIKILEKEPAVTVSPKSAPAKPGYKTSELWVTVALSVGAAATAAEGSLPARYSVFAAAIAAAAYVLSRGLAKH